MNPNDDAYVANKAACDAANAAAQAAYAAAQAANAAAQAAYDAAYAAAQAANAAAQPGNDDAYAATKAAYDAAYAAAQAACDAAYAAAQKKAKAVHVVSVTEVTKQYFTGFKKAKQAMKQAKKQDMRTFDPGDISDPVVRDVNLNIYRVTCQATENIYENKKRCLVALRDKEVMVAKDIYDAMLADAKTIYEHEMRRLRLMNEARKCIEDKQCSICFGCLDNVQTTKCTVCNHDIHTVCMRSWADACSTERRQLSCPLCRATWHAN